jgi:ABC-type dipeptide/oligopeptide/nickel transport system ATPase component
MAGGQTVRSVIVGKSGSGKSTLAKKIIKRFLDERRVSKLVIVNIKRELSEFCEKAIKVERDGDPSRLLKDHDRVFFQVLGQDPRPFMDKLGRAIMEHENVLVVVDEGMNFLPQSRVAHGFYTAYAGGRDQGISFLCIAQALISVTASLDLGILKQATHLTMFRLNEKNEVNRANEYVPEARGLIETLKKNDPTDPGAPERIIKNLDTGRAGAILRVPGKPFESQFVEFST